MWRGCRGRLLLQRRTAAPDRGGLAELPISVGGCPSRSWLAMKVKILALAFVWWASVQMTCAMAETYYYSGNARVYLPRWSATPFF